jgi:hypothetical protein
MSAFLINAKVNQIIAMTKALDRFWRQAHGWAPADAADLLAAARLDRQVSFVHTLPSYIEPFAAKEAEARLILGYVTLRSLCEGVLKLFFAVWLQDYLSDADAVKGKKGIILSPGKINFDQLIALYSKKGDSAHEMFLRRVQERGNAIHHFADKDVGSQDELIADIVAFGDFLVAVNSRLPYPDDHYNPVLA